MLEPTRRALSPERAVEYKPQSETRCKEVDHIRHQEPGSRTSSKRKRPHLQAMVEENNEILDILSVLDVKSMKRSELNSYDSQIESRIRDIES